ncbi:MAG: hypothetical protein AAFN93_07745 [Bacteroidota bacterium]
MKNLICLTLLVLVVSLVHGQESKKYLKYKNNVKYRTGYVLHKDSVKVKGLVKESLFNEAKKHSSVTFVHKDGRKVIFFPNQILGYGYSIYKFESTNSRFLKVVSSGRKVSLYENLSYSTYSTPGVGGGPATSFTTKDENFLVRRAGDTNFKLVRKRKFSQEFSKYFERCEELKKLILNKELTHKDIKTIVRRYNRCD